MRSPAIRMLSAAVLIAGAVVLLTGWSNTTPARPAPARGNFAGLVSIGGGRQMFLQCRGTGSPTVVLVSGLDAAADVWTGYQADPSLAVFARVARFVADVIRQVVATARQQRGRTSSLQARCGRGCPTHPISLPGTHDRHMTGTDRHPGGAMKRIADSPRTDHPADPKGWPNDQGRTPAAGRRRGRVLAGRGASRLLAWGAALVVPAGILAVVPAGQSRAASPGSAASAAPAVLTPVIQSVLSTPRWYRGDDARFHMEYELLLLNTVPLPVNVTGIDVLDGHGRPVESLTGDRLKGAMTLLGAEGKPATRLPASAAGVVWVDLSFAARAQIPAEVEHRLTVDVGPGLPVGPDITSTGGQTPTAPTAPIAISPPLPGGRWVAIGGTGGPHRRALQAINGALRLGQRFAIDFSARLDTDGRTHTGNPDQNTSYFNYGQPVLAVGAGTVVEAVDDLPDQIPNHDKPLPTADQDGNHVILSLGQGVFAGYAHLRPGSVRVRPGQRVRAGQILAELGNSGASSGPHLHFQLMTGPSLLDADGLPFVLRQFDLDGFAISLDAFLHADLTGVPVPINATAAGVRRGAGLTGLEVLSFPAATSRWLSR